MTHDHPHAPVAPATRAAMLAALAIVALHTVLVWGSPSVFWGDNGRWLHEVDRVAHGAVFYRDIYWSFPPLAMWILGGVTRTFGSDLTVIWTTTALIAAAIAALYGAAVARVVPGRLALLVSLTGMLLGAAYSQQSSAPLALGMYTPAVPVAMLCLVLQLLLFLRDWARPTLAGALLVGMVGGLGFLAKHDVWFACMWLSLAAGAATPPGREGRTRRVLAAGGGFGLVAGVGIAMLTAQHGAGALRSIFTGFGHVDEFSGINLPDLSMLTVETATLGLVLAGVAAIAWLGGAWRQRTTLLMLGGGLVLAGAAMAIWMWQAESVARQVLADGPTPLATLFEGALRPIEPTFRARIAKALLILRFQMLRHIVPLYVPMAMLALVVAARRRVSDERQWRLVTVLLIACLALRSRRMISFTEWSELMLEIPVYVAAASLLWPALRQPGVRALQLGCLVLVAFALRMHWRTGYGLGTRRGVEPTVATPRGAIRMTRGVARDLAYVRDLANHADPSGTRPLFAFGYSAGLSYFTGRPSVDPLTQGFRLSLLPTPDSAYRIAAAMKSRLLLVDNRAYGDAIPAARFAPWRWQPEMVQNPYLRVDRPLFEQLRAGCAEVTLPGRRSAIFTMYDCARAPSAGASPSTPSPS